MAEVGQVDGQPVERQQQPPVAVVGGHEQQPAPPVEGQNQNPAVDAAVLWQAIVDNINTMPRALERGDRLVETLADQLRRDAVVREREAEQSRWERLVPLCNGAREEDLLEWIRAIEQAPPELRRDLAGRTTQGALAESVRRYVADNPGGGWNGLRAALAQEYLSQYYAVAMQQELQLVAKGPHEPLPTFLRRFRRLADIAYPPQDRAPAADEIIVKGLARALGEELRLIAR